MIVHDHTETPSAITPKPASTIAEMRKQSIQRDLDALETADRTQLSAMAQAARDAMGKKRLEAIADRGHFSGPQIKNCHDTAIAVTVPKPMTSNAKAEGRYSKNDFVYIARDDEYQCPAGQRAICRYTSDEPGMATRTYWSSACMGCSIKAHCTTGHDRCIRRREHEAVLEAVQARLDGKPEAMTLRRSTVEHVFGTLKHWMGSTHVLTRGLRRIGTEMSRETDMQVRNLDSLSWHPSTRRRRSHVAGSQSPADSVEHADPPQLAMIHARPPVEHNQVGRAGFRRLRLVASNILASSGSISQ